MNTGHIEAIAKAVLYEGYMLYPYRPSSVKNRQRFNFGVLYPRVYSEAQSGSDAWSMQTECLVQGASPVVEVRVRFLKLIARTVSRLGSGPSAQVPSVDFPSSSQPWQEAFECEVAVPAHNLEVLAASRFEHTFAFPAKEETEPLRSAGGEISGVTKRTQESVRGAVEITANRLADGLFKLQVRVNNLTPVQVEDDAGQNARESTLMRSLVSAHIVLGVVDGQFVSLLDPPDDLRDLAAGCENLGNWPVLVGAEGERDTMLASPIILYDYPQIAPESPGDLFDGLEIDEILALRIMTMTDDEKREMRNSDDRARQVLERTEGLSMEHLAKLHGTLRELRPLREETP